VVVKKEIETAAPRSNHCSLPAGPLTARSSAWERLIAGAADNSVCALYIDLLATSLRLKRHIRGSNPPREEGSDRFGGLFVFATVVGS
jgi:hypothetical protein